MLKSRERGDTIVEVLFAVMVFSLLAVGSLSVMNQGAVTAQRSLEITLVREQVSTQARALRFLSNAYVSDYGKQGQATENWKQIIQANTVAPGQAQPLADAARSTGCVLPVNKNFTLDYMHLSDPRSAVLQPVATAATFAQVRYDTPKPTAEGIWIQAVRSAQGAGATGYYDFHITACWSSPGQDMPVTIGTIVRVYEPRE